MRAAAPIPMDVRSISVFRKYCLHSCSRSRRLSARSLNIRVDYKPCLHVSFGDFSDAPRRIKWAAFTDKASIEFWEEFHNTLCLATSSPKWTYNICCLFVIASEGRVAKRNALCLFRVETKRGNLLYKRGDCFSKTRNDIVATEGQHYAQI